MAPFSSFQYKNTLSFYHSKAISTGTVWFWEPDTYQGTHENGYMGTNVRAYTQSNPVAGVLNPETKALDPNGKYFFFASLPVWHTRPSAIFRYITNGSWGNALERDPERVKRDEYVSIEGARTLYGVVIKGDPVHDTEGLEVGLEATRQLREEMSANNQTNRVRWAKDYKI